MTKEIKIRTAQRDDQEKILKIFGEKERNFVEKSILLNSKGKISLILGEIDGEICGVLKLKRKREHIGNIGLVKVVDKFRRLGVGSALYIAAMHLFKKEGRIKIADQAPDDDKMKGFLNKLGFKLEGQLRIHTHDKKDVLLYAFFTEEQELPIIPDNVLIDFI